MKKLISILLLTIIIVSGVVFYNYYFLNQGKNDNITQKEYTFNNEYGEFNIVADKALKCRGTA